MQTTKLRNLAPGSVFVYKGDRFEVALQAPQSALTVVEQGMKPYFETDALLVEYDPAEATLIEPEPVEPPDQLAKADAGKPQLSLVPWQIVYDIAEIRRYGNEKYGDPDNWKQVEPVRYVNAMLRHALAFAANWFGCDKESGLRHLHHCACNVAFLCELLKDETDWKKEN